MLYGVIILYFDKCFSSEKVVLKGRVESSFKKQAYTVKISIGKEISGRCECPLSTTECHHKAAVLIFANKNISSTDSTCVEESGRDLHMAG